MSHAEPFDPGPPPPNVVFRVFAPLRLFACLVGVVLTAVAVSVGLELFGVPGPFVTGWWDDPRAQFERVGEALTPPSFGLAAGRWFVLAILVFPVWGVIGAFVVRADLAARYRPATGGDAAQFAADNASGLAMLPAVPVIIVLILTVPCLIGAGILAWMGSVGAVVVGVLLPVFLLANLLVLIFAAGLVGFPLMPVCRAFEGPAGDTFDAMSRTLNYAFGSPVVWLIGMALSVVALAAFTAPFAVVFAEYPPGSVAPMLWPVGAAFGFAAFWGVQTALYAKLRKQLDLIEPSEVVWEAPPPKPEKAAAEPAPSPEDCPNAPPSALLPRLTKILLLVGMTAATWLLTAETLGWLGGSAEWVRWWDEPAEPRTPGVKFAAYCAQLWTVAMGLLVFVAIRQQFRPPPNDDTTEGPGTIVPGP
jgi:hypothetical protein